jgi:FixJ family two-component response regulator
MHALQKLTGRERRFWGQIATGITSEKAAEAVGVRKTLTRFALRVCRAFSAKKRGTRQSQYRRIARTTST